MAAILNDVNLSQIGWLRGYAELVENEVGSGSLQQSYRPDFRRRTHRLHFAVASWTAHQRSVKRRPLASARGLMSHSHGSKPRWQELYEAAF
jgi:hypothetical protein